MKNEYYKNVSGWFDYPNLYLEAINAASDDDVLVEVGVFLGKSLSFLLEAAADSGKNLNIYGVDLFKITPDHGDGSMPWDENARQWEADNGGEDALWHEYNKYMDKHPNKSFLKGSIRKNSWDAAADFGDKSVHFCFIDASHLYENTLRDIRSWYPKIREGGIIAGHDYNQGVKRAVHEFFDPLGLSVHRDGSCWKVYL